jgi:hypothetical protein
MRRLRRNSFSSVATGRSVAGGEPFRIPGLRTIGLSFVFIGLLLVRVGGLGSLPGTGLGLGSLQPLALWVGLGAARA